IALGNLVGELPDVELSIRVHVTVAGSTASALCDTKMRPAEVAAHIVPWSAPSRASHEIEPPERSAPYTVPVRSPGRLWPAGPPSGWYSPHVGVAPDVTNAGQFASYPALPGAGCSGTDVWP